MTSELRSEEGSCKRLAMRVRSHFRMSSGKKREFSMAMRMGFWMELAVTRRAASRAAVEPMAQAADQRPPLQASGPPREASRRVATKAGESQKGSHGAPMQN